MLPVPNPLSQHSPFKVSAPADLLWAIIGLILTIAGTFLEAHITSIPWDWAAHGLQAQSLGVNCQVGAVLLTGCLGGRNAAAMSQIAYLLIGLTTQFNVFTQGGGIDYVHQPSFGYLLGFIPGAWLCGFLAFRVPIRLESLTFSCLCGLLTVHATGLAYLLIATQAFHWVDVSALSMSQTLLTFSVYPLPGQFAIVCGVAVLAFVFRHVMLY